METRTAQQTEHALETEILIRSIMRRKRIRGVDIAVKHGWHRSGVNRQIRGINVSRDVRQAIADELGMKYDELWREE
jgi:post-segregation antitoxin (ccd killing protein)